MQSSNGDHPSDVVRRGYDALSLRYRSDDAEAGLYAPWIAELSQRLGPSASVLDVGCGCGVPVARDLAAAGHRVTGVDISDVQIERARRLVPDAEFLRADATEIDFPPGSFHAVVALYSLIHMPLDAQQRLISSMARWLTEGGTLLLVAGAQAWTGTEDRWLGGDAAMWWSHPDAGTYRRWLQDAGFDVVHEEFVPEGDGGHALFRAELT